MIKQRLLASYGDPKTRPGETGDEECAVRDKVEVQLFVDRYAERDQADQTFGEMTVFWDLWMGTHPAAVHYKAK